MNNLLVVQSSQGLRDVGELFIEKKIAAVYVPKHAIQLGQQPVGLDELRLGQAGTIDLTVDAVEVADLVRIQVNADRNAATPSREYRVDKLVPTVGAGVIGVERDAS